MLYNTPVCIFAMYNYKAHKNKDIINTFLYLTFHKSYNLQLYVQDTSAIFI
jgi:hypothetical protein